MKIGVIGTGKMGGGLARAFSRSGRHEVTMGSRDPDKARARAAEVGAAGGGTYRDALDGAEVVVLAVPWRAVDETLPELGDLSGKVVIDITNPYTEAGLEPLEGTSTAEEIQKRLPGARVVKGWNHIYARNLARPDVDGQAASVFICGDDEEAKATVEELARDAGFDPVDVGPLAATRYLERLNVVTGGLKLGPDRPLKVLRYPA